MWPICPGSYPLSAFAGFIQHTSIEECVNSRDGPCMTKCKGPNEIYHNKIKKDRTRWDRQNKISKYTIFVRFNKCINIALGTKMKNTITACPFCLLGLEDYYKLPSVFDCLTVRCNPPSATLYNNKVYKGR